MEDRELYFADEKALRNWKIKRILSRIGIYTFLTIVAIFIIIPFYWMIATSLKSAAEADLIRPTFFPKKIMWSNYALIFKQVSGFGRYFFNTIFVSICTTSLVVVTTIFAAFAFGILNFKGKNAIFMLLLVTMMIPGEMMVITNYATISALGWMETYAALILPFGVSVFYIYYLRQTFMSIPHELYLAAKVDGVGDFKYLFKVIIPIAAPAIVTIIILQSMSAWNAYIWPQLVANAGPLRMVSNGLMAALTDEFSQQVNMQLTASTIVTLPLFIFFVLFRKYIMRGVSRSGIKG